MTVHYKNVEICKAHLIDLRGDDEQDPNVRPGPSELGQEDPGIASRSEAVVVIRG